MMANTTPTISDVVTLKEVLDSAAKEAIHVKTVATVTRTLMANISPTLKACYKLALSVSQMMGSRCKVPR